jgi:two-component system sensor histidine kinase BaeS
VTTRTDHERLALLVHEVRSPTAALAAIAAALADDVLEDDAMAELIGLALAACRGIERIVNDATPGSVRFEDVDVVALAHAAVAGAELGGGRVRATLQPRPLHVRGDPVRIRQALDSLIVNALVHAPAGADVVVGANALRGNVLIFVQDSGHGIPPEHHGRIFDPGVRLDKDVPGSGLGLAVARAIAQAHGGTLTVRSSPGEGATFTLVLPGQEAA